ncbi:anaerobic C4-dicarboxylate transporter family protein [Vibrio metschnikovii]
MISLLRKIHVLFTYAASFAVIFTGIRYGGIAFGLLGGLGVSVLAFVFGVAPERRQLVSC